MNPITKWTLRQRRRSIVGWSVAAVGLIFINMVFYPSFKNQAAELQKSFESLPDAAVQLFGGSTDFFSPVGFLNSQIYFLMLPLILGIMAIGLGSRLLAQEEQENTIELILSRPTSRSSLLLQKAIAGIVAVGIATIFALLTTLIVGKVVSLDVPAKNILVATLACYLLVLSLASVAYVFSAIGKTRGISIAAAAFYGLGGYLISSLSGTVHWLEKPSKLFSFNYYQSEQILSGVFVWKNFLFFVAVIAGCAIISWYVFRRRDLSS